MPMYDKSTKELIKDYIESFVPSKSIFNDPFNLLSRKLLTDGGYFSRREILDWFQINYPKLKTGTINAHLAMMSTNAKSRVHYILRPNGLDDLLYQINSSHFRLYDKESDPVPIYKKNLYLKEAEDDDNGEIENISNEIHEFAYEKDLRNFLSKNLHIIRPSLALYQDDGLSGVEFPVGERNVDILAFDKQDLVVIELKVSKGHERAIGQLLRYMGWIQKNLAEPGQKVKGMIIGRYISNDLRLAASQVQNIELFEYQLSITLNSIEL